MSLHTSHLKYLGPQKRNGRSEVTNLFGMEKNLDGVDSHVLRKSDGTVQPANWLKHVLHMIVTEFKSKDDKIKQMSNSFSELVGKYPGIVVPNIPSSLESRHREDMNLEQEIEEFSAIVKSCKNWAGNSTNKQFTTQQALIHQISIGVIPWINKVQPLLWNSELSFLLSSFRNPEKRSEFMIGNPFYKADGSKRTQTEFLSICTETHVGQFYMVRVYFYF